MNTYHKVINSDMLKYLCVSFEKNQIWLDWLDNYLIDWIDGIGMVFNAEAQRVMTV